MLLEQLGRSNLARQTPFIPKGKLEQHYLSAKKRLFLFDYDGTLAPIVKVPSMATPSDNTLRALETLSSDPKNIVYIISGRDQAFLEQHLGHIKNLGMSAEHGGFIREPGVTTWSNFTESLDMTWMGEVLEIFKYYTEVRGGLQLCEGFLGCCCADEMVSPSERLEVRSRSRRAQSLGIIGPAIPSGGKLLRICCVVALTQTSCSLFQCRQCQDLLENNLARKRPIEGRFSWLNGICQMDLFLTLQSSWERRISKSAP